MGSLNRYHLRGGYHGIDATCRISQTVDVAAGDEVGRRCNANFDVLRYMRYKS